MRMEKEKFYGKGSINAFCARVYLSYVVKSLYSHLIISKEKPEIQY
jgi:hypothetical protein